MGFLSQAIPAGWGADTIQVFTADRLNRLLVAATAAGRPLKFLWRYNVTMAERDIILPRLPLLLVERVQRPGWQSGGSAGGEAAGKRQVANAKLIQYPTGSHLGVDLEGLGDQGATVEQYVLGRCKVLRGEGFLPAGYEGYDDGFPDDARTALSGDDGFDVWWSDYGPRTVIGGIGFVLTQHPQVTVGGTLIDWDECHGTDLRGRQLFGMSLEQDKNVEPDDGVLPSERVTQPDLPQV